MNPSQGEWTERPAHSASRRGFKTRWLLAAWLVGVSMPLSLCGQASTSTESISRELGIFKLDSPPAAMESIAREFSVFKLGEPSSPVEAISRELSLHKLNSPSASHEAISREISLFKNDAPSAPVEAISRELSLFKLDVPSAPVEAISREVSVEKVPPPTCVPPPGGLIGWWPGDGDVNDLVSGSTGNPLNGAGFAPGKARQGFSLDGVDDYIDFGGGQGDFGTNDFSITFWIRSSASRQEAIVSKRSGCGLSYFWEFLLGYGAPGTVFFCCMEDGRVNENRLVSSRRLNDGEFHLVTATREGARITMYLDGVAEVSQITAGVTRLANGAALRVGRSSCTGISDSPFTGALDELAFFNRALASNEIAAIYAAGSAGMCKPSVPPSIVQQPTDLTLYAGQPGSFSVLASGDFPLRYQWRFNGSSLTGETNRVLTFSSPQSATAGPYEVVVNNAIGAVTSIVAMLTVRLDVPDLAVHQLSVPGEVGGGQVIPVVFTVTNRGLGSASLPWSNSVFLATNVTGGGLRVLVSPPQLVPLGVGEFLTVTQSVIVPFDLSGTWYAGATVNQGNTVFETNRANNTLVLASPTFVSSPDLEVNLLAVANTGVFGQSVSATWTVRNRGT